MADQSKPEASEGGIEPTAPYSSELAGLNAGADEDLHGEIALLRAAIQNLAGRSSRETLDFDTWQKTVGVLGMACSRLAGLIRAQRKLEQDRTPETAEIMSRALAEALKELGI
ncbi:MAG TPA: hypothetical protein VMT46_19445 [Anaerolineaceae bacterium]|nr:hypothetical protein [Anaerolineaceae bacterium]